MHSPRPLAHDDRGSGPTLVLLHGGWLDRDLWTPQLDTLARDRRVVAPDLRDHGGSPRGDGGYDVATLADDVAALLDHLGVARAAVAGLSLGGLVAQRLAADRPDRVAGLVLADTVTSVPPLPIHGAAKRLLLPKAPAHLAARTMGAGAYFRLLLDWVEGVEGGRWLARTAAARRYALAAVDRFGVDRFLRVFDALYGFAPVDPAAVAAPALVVHGAHEAGAVVSQNRRLAAALDAERVVLPGAGHLSNRDAPAAFDEAVTRFLDERVPASG